jgi:hypothetical protein
MVQLTIFLVKSLKNVFLHTRLRQLHWHLEQSRLRWCKSGEHLKVEASLRLTRFQTLAIWTVDIENLPFAIANVQSCLKDLRKKLNFVDKV